MTSLLLILLKFYSLTAELRDKKQVVQRLTDENGDLSQDVMLLRNRYNKYEKDLEAAQKV